jgi:hypothetical protein
MTAPEQPTPEPVRQLMRGLTALRLEVASAVVDDLTALAQAALTAVAAQRAAEAVETTDIGELLDSPPPPNEALTRLLTSPSPWGEQDREIAEIQEEHGAQWRLKHRWIIVDNGDGSFTVHEHSGDSVWPSTDYPNKRLAAARLLQLLGIGPVAPQAHPESVCIELPGEGTAADTTATPPPGDAAGAAVMKWRGWRGCRLWPEHCWRCSARLHCTYAEWIKEDDNEDQHLRRGIDDAARDRGEGG